MTTKAKRVGKNSQEIKKPRGFERGLEIDEIVGMANVGKTSSTLMFLVRWIGCDELDLIPAAKLNRHAPDAMIAFYEERSSINHRFELREQQRAEAALRPIPAPTSTTPIISKLEHIPQTEIETTTETMEMFETPMMMEGAAPAEDSTQMMVQISEDFNMPPMATAEEEVGLL